MKVNISNLLMAMALLSGYSVVNAAEKGDTPVTGGVAVTSRADDAPDLAVHVSAGHLRGEEQRRVAGLAGADTEKDRRAEADADAARYREERAARLAAEKEKDAENKRLKEMRRQSLVEGKEIARKNRAAREATAADASRQRSLESELEAAMRRRAATREAAEEVEAVNAAARAAAQAPAESTGLFGWNTGWGL